MGGGGGGAASTTRSAGSPAPARGECGSGGWGVGGRQLGTTEFAGLALGVGRGAGGKLGTPAFAASRTPARGEGWYPVGQHLHRGM